MHVNTINKSGVEKKQQDTKEIVKIKQKNTKNKKHSLFYSQLFQLILMVSFSWHFGSAASASVVWDVIFLWKILFLVFIVIDFKKIY